MLGSIHTYTSIPRIDPWGLDHVPSWHLISLRGLDQWPTYLHCLWQWKSMMFSMFHCLKYMQRMLNMWLNGLYCRWSQKESWNHSVYCKERHACFITEQSSTLKCSGSTLGPMKLHGKWWIRCELCILMYSLVEQMFLVYVFYDVFGICI